MGLRRMGSNVKEPFPFVFFILLTSLSSELSFATNMYSCDFQLKTKNKTGPWLGIETSPMDREVLIGPITIYDLLNSGQDNTHSFK